MNDTNPDSFDINGVQYVPFNPGQMLAHSMKSGKFKKSFSPDDFSKAMKAISGALTRLGGPLALPEDFAYAGKLYPADAITTLALSRTRFWPMFAADDVLEMMLGKWMKTNVPDYGVYAKELFNAIHATSCVEGVYLRLNLDSIAKPSTSRITISSRYGSVTQEKSERRDVFQGVARDRVVKFLREHGVFVNNMDEIYAKLKSAHNAFNLEQALLAWMGYLMVKSIAENSNVQMKIHENKLLMLPRLSSGTP